MRKFRELNYSNGEPTDECVVVCFTAKYVLDIKSINKMLNYMRKAVNTHELNMLGFITLN